MQDSFEDVMSKKSDEELIAIVTIDKSKYQESAIISAEREIEKRNIDIMSSITNQELIDIVTNNRSNYHEKFIDSAEKEIDKREIDNSYYRLW